MKVVDPIITEPIEREVSFEGEYPTLVKNCWKILGGGSYDRHHGSRTKTTLEAYFSSDDVGFRLVRLN